MMLAIHAIFLSAGLLAATAPPIAPVRTPSLRLVDYGRDVQPIFTRACVECHGPHKASGGMQMVTAEKVIEGGFAGESVVPGEPETSYLMERLLGHGDEDQMPIKGDPLTPAEIETVRMWIVQGARFRPTDAPEFQPKKAGMIRLTVTQYGATLRTLFGDGIAIPNDLERDTLISGSAVVGGARFGTSRRATERFAKAAFDVARQAIADPHWRNRWLGCLPTPSKKRLNSGDIAGTESCLANFFTRFGRIAWRRPVTAPEIARYVYLGVDTAAGSGVNAGAEAVIAALLQSPHFLYRTEIGVEDAERPGLRRLTDFEIATRLSYFLLGTTPDEALLDRAASGELSSARGLKAEAERLLELPGARITVRWFFIELMRLGLLEGVVAGQAAFKQLRTPTLAAAMLEQSLRLIESVVLNPKRDFREIFDSPVTFVNRELVTYYGYDTIIPADVFAEIPLPPGSGRAGVLTEAGFLALQSGPTGGSPTRRGKFIREQLLCQAVPPPPPDVSSKLPEHLDSGPATLRQRLEAHRSAKQCKGCHKAMDPMGMAFENFDGAGRFRSEEQGLPIDASGTVDGVDFKNASDLGKLLRGSDRVGACMARNLFRFAMGTLETESDEPLIEELTASLSESGYSFPALLIAVVGSRGFRFVSESE